MSRPSAPSPNTSAKARAGVPEHVATSNAQAFGLIAEGDAAWITDDVLTITGHAPRSVHAFINEHAAAFG